MEELAAAAAAAAADPQATAAAKVGQDTGAHVEVICSGMLDGDGANHCGWP
jgi:hypothetical protein